MAKNNLWKRKHTNGEVDVTGTASQDLQDNGVRLSATLTMMEMSNTPSANSSSQATKKCESETNNPHNRLRGAWKAYTDQLTSFDGRFSKRPCHQNYSNKHGRKGSKSWRYTVAFQKSTWDLLCLTRWWECAQIWKFSPTLYCANFRCEEKILSDSGMRSGARRCHPP